MLLIKNIQKYDCDVLIAGGGPAGSGLAFHLASNGFKVIVAEAEKFPRDKVCGDGVSPIALAELAKMGITQTQKFALANEVKEVGLYYGSEKVIIPLSKPGHLPFHARIIPRIELDNWVYEAAKKAGAAYLESTRVTGYTINKDVAIAQLKKGQIFSTLRAKIIIGADGSTSTLARQLNGNKPNDEFQLLGLRSYFENVNGPTNRVDIYFSEESFPGIFWMFPKGAAGANIGMAMVSKTLPSKPSHVKEMLLNHINNNPAIRERIGGGEMVGKIQGWPIIFFNKKSVISGQRILLVGDAAGLINPLSGDGIQYALLSASWASETIIDCLQKNDFSEEALHLYRIKVDKELGYDFALSNLLVQFPRNKTLSKLWMGLLEVIIAEAKEDKVYADSIAGIFEGTYPSYKALNLSFILKSVKQGVNGLGNSFVKNISNPEVAINKGLQISGTIATLLEELNKNQDDQIGWLKNTVGKTVSLAGQMAQHFIRK